MVWIGWIEASADVVVGNPGTGRELVAGALATLPAVALTLVARDALEAQFDRPAVAGVCLLVTAAFLWTTRRSVLRAESGGEPNECRRRP